MSQPTESYSGAGGRPSEDNSLGDLVATATKDLSALLHMEIELAKAELKSDLKQAGLGFGLLGGAGALAAIGGLFLLVGVALLIAIPLTIWAGFLIVAAPFLVGSALFGLLGLEHARRVGKPGRTIETVKKDLALMRHPGATKDG